MYLHLFLLLMLDLNELKLLLAGQNHKMLLNFITDAGK